MMRLVPSTEDCFSQRRLPTEGWHSLCIGLIRLALPRALGGFCRWPLVQYGATLFFGLPWGGICDAALTPAPLFPARPPPFFSFLEHQQPTIPNNSPSTTVQATKSGICLNTPSMITATALIIRTLLIMCRTIPLPAPLLTWLSPLEPKLRYRDIQERRAENVGEWLLQTEEFQRWHNWSGESEGDKAVLFCYGGPGSERHLLGKENYYRTNKS